MRSNGAPVELFDGVENRIEVKFLSLSSGSSGNCYFLGRFLGGKCLGGILIDAGVSLKRLKSTLAESGLSTDDFCAVLVTHDHMDHVRSLASYCKKLSIPVWSSSEVIDALRGRTLHLGDIGASLWKLTAGEWNEVGGFLVRFFVVPHDATQTIGYAIRVPLSIETGESDAFHRFFIMTDAGRVTDEAVDFAKESDTVVFESNYDVDMLLGGPYPHDLKMRIMNGHGHISNDECAAALRRFVHSGLRNIFLCHLSENNNTPRLAYETSRAVLDALVSEGKIKEGATSLRPLPRTSSSGLIVL